MSLIYITRTFSAGSLDGAFSFHIVKWYPEAGQNHNSSYPSDGTTLFFYLEKRDISLTNSAVCAEGFRPYIIPYGTVNSDRRGILTNSG